MRSVMLEADFGSIMLQDKYFCAVLALWVQEIPVTPLALNPKPLMQRTTPGGTLSTRHTRPGSEPARAEIEPRAHSLPAVLATTCHEPSPHGVCFVSVLRLLLLFLFVAVALLSSSLLLLLLLLASTWFCCCMLLLLLLGSLLAFSVLPCLERTPAVLPVVALEVE